MFSSIEKARSQSGSSATAYPRSTPAPSLAAHLERSRSRSVRPRTAASTIMTGEQRVIVAVADSRGMPPVIGLAFLNLTTTEAVLSQITDNQTFTRTEQKLAAYEPNEILCISSSLHPVKSKLLQVINDNFPNISLIPLDRKLWSDSIGLDYVQKLAIISDLEAIKLPLDSISYALGSFAAVIDHASQNYDLNIPQYSLRVKYEPSQDSMMIDATTREALELTQNSLNSRSKSHLLGYLRHTLTPMGARRLRINILQPSTDKAMLERRFEAIDELLDKDDVFAAVRQALQSCVDADRVLTAINTVPRHLTIDLLERSINTIIMFKQFINTIPLIAEALVRTESELLRSIYELCDSPVTSVLSTMINNVINEDVEYQSHPLGLRNQRTFAVKSGVNGLLDVARQSYKEATADAYQLVAELAKTVSLPLEMKYDSGRFFFIRLARSSMIEDQLPDVFIHVVARKQWIECQTLDLLNMNQKIADAHFEVLQLGDSTVQQLTHDIRAEISPFFKISEAIALLDLLASFAWCSQRRNLVRPEFTETLAVKSGRHPILELEPEHKVVGNDAYASHETRFQIITGCNMSGKSTYIRSLAIITIIAQLGCFVPASFATIPIRHQLFMRAASDNSNTALMSSFGAEMRETAFILRNVSPESMVLIDELGRGTSARDGLCIATAIAEVLIESKAIVWFVTHMRDLAQFLGERSGVINLHLEARVQADLQNIDMLYRVAGGHEKQIGYGITLASMVGFPADVIEVAMQTAKELQEGREKEKGDPRALIIIRRQKVVLGLEEQLLHAQKGKLAGEALESWLQELKREFLKLMLALDEEEAKLPPSDLEVALRDDRGEEIDKSSMCYIGLTKYMRLHGLEIPQVPRESTSQVSPDADTRSLVTSGDES